MIRKNILVYQDEGTSPYCVQETLMSLKLAVDTSVYNIQAVSSNILNTYDWENDTALLIFPGGRSLPFYSSLSGNGKKGNEKIINYVEQGGHYLGICAGAYYGAAVTDFERGGPLESLFYGPLNFFKGQAQGPAYGLGKFVFNSDQGAEVGSIIWCSEGEAQQVYSVYFNGGSNFANAEEFEGVSILARYHDLDHKPAAIIKCDVGKGSAILTGVHIEYSYKSIAEADPIYSRLKSAEPKRRLLFRNVLTKLDLEVINQENLELNPNSINPSSPYSSVGFFPSQQEQVEEVNKTSEVKAASDYGV